MLVAVPEMGTTEFEGSDVLPQYHSLQQATVNEYVAPLVREDTTRDIIDDRTTLLMPEGSVVTVPG